MKNKEHRQICPKCNSVMYKVEARGIDASFDADFYICIKCDHRIIISCTKGYKKNWQ